MPLVVSVSHLVTGKSGSSSATTSYFCQVVATEQPLPDQLWRPSPPNAGEETPRPAPFSPRRCLLATAVANSRVGAMAELQLVRELDAGSVVAASDVAKCAA
jgi:hypothetical protein